MSEWKLTAKYQPASDTVVIAATRDSAQAFVEISSPMLGEDLATALDYIAANIRRFERGVQ